MRLLKVMLGVAILCFVVAVPSAMAQAPGTSPDPTKPQGLLDMKPTPTACWKKTDTRGVGTVPTHCEPNHDKDAGLCYDRCPDGFKGVGPVCWQHCPDGYKDDGATCRRDAHITKKDSYGRGVGKPMHLTRHGWRCSDSHPDKDAGLCYENCRGGYHGVGPVCWQDRCPDGYHDDGGTCRRDVHIFGKKTHKRGVGTVPKICDPGHELDAGLCYKDCPKGYKGVGPVCWAHCGDMTRAKGINMPVECGAACAKSKTACTINTAKWSAAGLKVAAGIGGKSKTLPADVLEAEKKFTDVPICGTP